ncbi:MAG: 2-hydroxychromene-2-carboxylate isomerase [Solirubrobacterales bacterium]
MTDLPKAVHRVGGPEPSTPGSPAPGGDLAPESSTAFYFDLGSPYAYLTAERISRLFADAELAQPEWRPVLLGALFGEFERSSWMVGPEREVGMAEVERRAASYGLQPIRWPNPVPANTLYAMRVATYAKSIGRSVSFALAAFRQAFAGGRDLTDPDNVAIAAAACELHPNAVAKGAGSQSVKRTLRETTESAASRGVRGVPTVTVGEEVFWGDDRLEEAVRRARRRRG